MNVQVYVQGREDVGLNPTFSVFCDPSKGAQLDVQDDSGSTALIDATIGGYADLVGLLSFAGQYSHTYTETNSNAQRINHTGSRRLFYCDHSCS